MAGAGKSVYLEAYGCTASFADAEMMAGMIKSAGFDLASSPEEAEANVIVTCTVKTPTAHRMMARIRELGRAKPLVVAGCMPRTEGDLIESIDPRASLVGPDAIDKIVEAVEGSLIGEKLVFLEKTKKPKLLLPHLRRNQVVGVVEIASGCLSSCSFCQVKIAKGVLQSYPGDMVVEEARLALEDGCKEIWLTSTDCGCYGRDIRTDLPSLVRQVCNLPGDFFVRVGMINPLHLKGRGVILEKLIDAYRDPKVFKFLHIPVQSGSNRILKAMRRGHTVETFLDIVQRFRSSIPELTLSTDIIVGFPTESEEDFQRTVNLLEEVEPDVVNCSRFGARPGTEAYHMPRLDPEVVKARSQILHKHVRKLMAEANSEWLGWKGTVLVDEVTEKGVVGRNLSYKPIGINAKTPIGRILDVKIIGRSEACLIGEPVLLG